MLNVYVGLSVSLSRVFTSSATQQLLPKFNWGDPFIVMVVALVVHVNKRWADVDLASQV